VCWSDQECAGMRTRIFRPDAIPTIRYMIHRDSFSFATLDIISVQDEDGWNPMKSNHSVRVQSESSCWRLARGRREAARLSAERRRS